MGLRGTRSAVGIGIFGGSALFIHEPERGCLGLTKDVVL
jgi:hypothetical protein